MTESQLYAALTEIFQIVLMRDELVLTPELSAKDVPGWDSFKQIEILIATEQRFVIRISTREVDRLKTVGDLATVVAAKYRAKTPG
jgi:acyl carrier protein